MRVGTLHGGGHSHGESNANEARVFWAMILTAGFMFAEIAGGIISGSLALLADAGHMLTDAAALGLAWGAFRIARKPADTNRTYGYGRFQVIAAFINGITLFFLVGWIIWEAIERILSPIAILPLPMLIVAILGLVVNIAAFLILHKGAKDNLNMEGALLHVVGDMLGSIAAIMAAIVIYYTGWSKIDPILSIFVALLILRSGWYLLKKTSHILMEGTPDSIDVAALKLDLIDNIKEVKDIHHVHVWLLSSDSPLITLHATIDNPTHTSSALSALKTRLDEIWELRHSTIQIEIGNCADH